MTNQAYNANSNNDGTLYNQDNDPIWILAETCSCWKRDSYLPLI